MLGYILLAYATYTYSSLASSSITDCGAGAGLFQITELSMDPPTTISPGQNLSLTLKYTTPIEVDSGKVNTALTLNGIPFPSSNTDLCATTTCPILPGDHDGSSWSLFPSGVSGKVTTTIKWMDNITNALYLCIKATVQASGPKNESAWTSWLRGSLQKVFL